MFFVRGEGVPTVCSESDGKESEGVQHTAVPQLCGPVEGL